MNDDRIITSKEIHDKVVNLGYEVDKLIVQVRIANRQIGQISIALGLVAFAFYLVSRKVVK